MLTWTRVDFLEFWLFHSLQLIWRWRWTFMMSCVKKPSPDWLHSCVHCPPERRRAKSFCTRDALMKNLTTKKLWHSKLSKLDPQAYRFLGIMFYKCIIDRRKSCFDFNGITALSLLGRFNMSVQLHFLNFLWEPS